MVKAVWATGKQAQQMQRKKMQKNAQGRDQRSWEVTGESGAGLVKVTINGAHNCRRVEIDPSLLEDDKEMLEDTVATAFNDTNSRRIEETQKEKWPLYPPECGLPRL